MPSTFFKMASAMSKELQFLAGHEFYVKLTLMSHTLILLKGDRSFKESSWEAHLLEFLALLALNLSAECSNRFPRVSLCHQNACL